MRFCCRCRWALVLISRAYFKLGLYTMRCGRLCGEFLHHTYKVRFPLILHCTSHVDGSNWSTPSSVHHSGAVRLVRFPKKKKKNHIRIIKQPTQKYIKNKIKTQILTNKHVQNISIIPTQNFQTNL